MEGVEHTYQGSNKTCDQADYYVEMMISFIGISQRFWILYLLLKTARPTDLTVGIWGAFALHEWEDLGQWWKLAEYVVS